MIGYEWTKTMWRCSDIDNSIEYWSNSNIFIPFNKLYWFQLLHFEIYFWSLDFFLNKSKTLDLILCYVLY